MSWYIEVCGTPEEVNAAIDEEAARSGGMPPVVSSYLKDAVAACTPPTPANYTIYVKSCGHRPLTSGGSAEECTVRLLRAKPWSAGT